MKHNFKPGDLVVTNNFTLKQDICRVEENGQLKVIGRYERKDIFKQLENIINSEHLAEKKINIYVKDGQFIPDFKFYYMLKSY